MGFYKVDKSWLKTHDMFLRKGSIISNYIIEQIENDENYAQILRRLCRYMTIDPISAKSKDYAGNIVVQKDLKDSLFISTKEGTYFDYVDDKGETVSTTSKQCLFNESFNQEMKRIEQCFIFIHNYRNKPVREDVGEIYIRIDVIIPNKYDNIIDYDSKMNIKRGECISFIIDDLLNHRTITDTKYSKYTGNIKFELVDCYNERLTKTSDGIVYTLVYSLATARGEILNGNL